MYVLGYIRICDNFIFYELQMLLNAKIMLIFLYKIHSLFKKSGSPFIL